MSRPADLGNQSPASPKLSDVRRDVREELQLQLDDFRKRLVQQITHQLRSEFSVMAEPDRADRAMRRAPPMMFASSDAIDAAKPARTSKCLKSAIVTDFDKLVRKEISLQRSRPEDGPAVAKSRQSRDVEIRRFVDDEDIENIGLRQIIIDFLSGESFGYFITFLVVLNAILIGVETDYTARHRVGAVMPFSQPINRVFGCVFSVEVALKLVFFGCWQFFIGPDWRWNTFDFIVVSMQWLDECGHMMAGKDGNSGMSFLRVFRMMRIARIMRLARVIQFVVELRTMISSITASLKPLCWASVLFGMLIYMVAVVMTQMVNDRRVVNDDLSPSIEHYFSSLGVAVMSLWQCISGGMDWQDMAAPLSDEVSPLMGIMFTCYIAFSMLAMMNVITGIFVDNASQYAQQDRDAYVVKHVVNLFKKSELNAAGDLSWDTFATKLKTKELDEFFKAVDVDMSDARGLFNLVDADMDGNVSPEELMQGWVRLKGPAKALELSLLSREIITANELTSKQLGDMGSALNWLCQQTRKDDVADSKPQERPPCIDDGNLQGLAAESAQSRLSIRHGLQRVLPKRMGATSADHRNGYEPLISS